MYATVADVEDRNDGIDQDGVAVTSSKAVPGETLIVEEAPLAAADLDGLQEAPASEIVQTQPGGPRLRAMAALRILFGVAWAVDATFKYLPGFNQHFESFLRQGISGRPAWVASWIHD